LPTGTRINHPFANPLITMARRHQLLVPVLLLASALAPTAALANEVMAGSCPLLVAPSNSEFQPKRIQPSQVAAKNAAGCLSPADAIYGPDGCPQKLCGANSGVIPLPGS
jgi:hypothetical protein